jgi:hypothetical protein
MSDKDTKENKSTDLVELCRTLTTQNYVMKQALKKVTIESHELRIHDIVNKALRDVEDLKESNN